jgi:hypothetical protein
MNICSEFGTNNSKFKNSKSKSLNVTIELREKLDYVSLDCRIIKQKRAIK